MDPQNSHIPAQRRQLILAELSTAGAVRVDELGRRFDVSEMTVRRDLDALEAEGLLERTHGGAIALKAVTGERHYRDKDEENREEKEAIGRMAAELVGENETVLINSGSTTRYVIRYLASRKDIRIITNNLAAVAELPDETSAEILLLGGRFRNASGCVVGDWAEKQLENLSPSRAILGADGISLKEGLSSPIPEEAALTRLMIERTRGPVTIVADAGKIGKICSFGIVGLSEISELVTDAEAEDHWVQDFAAIGVKVVGGIEN
ncbi:MAG: DeoR/GlpR transcriptional regulator [Spirochaetaceae bacterium]|nr:DeoR/GlpR transcriptional regulator [Spirochaetaceae bacterium]